MIGFLRSASLANAGPLVTAFRQGLNESGYVEGHNVVIEFRSAEGHNDELPKLVTELLRLPVAVIVCNVTAASAAKAITSSIPIVFATGDDPVAEGRVTSLNRPGGNVTGVSFLGNALGRTCQSNSQQKSSWSSTSRLPRPSASRCRNQCSWPPTR